MTKILTCAAFAARKPVAYANDIEPFQLAHAWASALTGDPDNAVFNWRFIHDKDAGKPAIKRRGTLAQMWQQACNWNVNGYGIFATVNEMDGTGYDATGNPIQGASGDTLEHVAAIRAHVVDLDNLSAMQNLQRAENHTIKPQFIVQTSPGKAHVYWVVTREAGAVDLDGYRRTQRKLRQLYDGDPAVIDATRVLRVPGFWHQKGAPQLVTCRQSTGYGATMPAGFVAASVAHINAIDAGEHERKPLGDPGLAAPSREWVIEAIRSMPVDGLDHASFISFLSAWKQAAWNHFEEHEARQMFLDWCASIPGHKGVDYDLKHWNDIKQTEIGWKSLLRQNVALNAKFMFYGVNLAPQQGIVVNQTSRLLQPLSESIGTLKPASWLIKGVLPARSTGILFGEPGAGKSFAAIDMAASVAAGEMFNLHKSKRGSVVYIAGEGHAAITTRFKARLTGDQTNAAERIHISSRSVTFAGTTQDVQTLIAELDGMAEPPRLVVIDTLFRATVGADVNSHEDMSKFWQVIDQMKERYGCTVLVVHHSGRNEVGRSFGSVVLLANADFEISVTTDESGNKVISNTKQKDAEEFAPMAFKLNQVSLGFVQDEFGDMENVTSCTIEFVPHEPKAEKSKQRELRELAKQYETPSREPSRKIAHIMAKIHDCICEANGIALNDTVLDVRIPESTIKHFLSLNQIGLSHNYRNGIQGLLAPSGNSTQWVDALKEGDERYFTLTEKLLRFGRTDSYDHFQNLTLTQAQIDACYDGRSFNPFPPGGPGVLMQQGMIQ